MYSYRFTRQYLFHYFYVSIHTGKWTSQSHCHHINCLLVIFFSAVVGGESYLWKRSFSFLWFAHTCKRGITESKREGGGWRIFALFIGHTLKMHHVHLLMVIAIMGISIQSQQMHTFYLSKLRCGFPSPKINEIAGNYSMHG